MSDDLFKNATTREWTGLARGFGALLGAFILYAHYAFPNTDPAPDLSTWIRTELPKLGLGLFLLLPWSRVRFAALWYALFFGLVFCISVFLYRGVLSTFWAVRFASTIDGIAVPLLSECLVGSLLIAQIVAVWKIHEGEKKRTF